MTARDPETVSREWKRRLDATPAPGRWWCSDGELVWTVESTGLAAQFANAFRAKYVMPFDGQGDKPEPPHPEGIVHLRLLLP